MHFLQEIIIRKITSLWDKTTSNNVLSKTEMLLFLTLCFLENFYRLGFLIVQKAKPLFFSPYQAPCKIIAVGNLSVGGTGKSVLVQFLVKHLVGFQCGIISRGYNRIQKDDEGCLLVCDGKNIFYEASVCGDEPFMLAKNLSIPCVVGSDRAQSLQLLLKNAYHNEHMIDAVILDDGYQNQHLIKDIQILLIDARKPFENGHCFPAGRLREKDFSRADVIVLTHADAVGSHSLHSLKSNLKQAKKDNLIVCGVHKVSGIFEQNSVFVSMQEMKSRRLFATAGIGSFSGFLESLKSVGLTIGGELEFADHHHYTADDIKKIIEYATHHFCQGIIVTEKDWVKLSSLIPQIESLSWYVIRIEFEFLTTHEYHSFMKVIKEGLL